MKRLKQKVLISLEETLLGGQSFRWKKIGDEFRGVAFNIVWCLKQATDGLEYQVMAELPYGSGEKEGTEDKLLKIRMKVDKPKERKKKTPLLYPDSYYESLLSQYLQLHVNLDVECKKWRSAHPHFEQIANEKATAIRQLDQDPVENLFSFICSQNNHINRISSLVDKLTVLYGTHIADIDGVSYHNFPAVESLAGVEQTLREHSFGYRAKFIAKSAQEICEKGGLQWFSALKKMSYKEARAELMTLTGIGPKVSDCICLMSIGHLSAIPVDTHIFKIAQQHYMDDLKLVKSVNNTIYSRIGDKFRDIYGPLAGWAQTILFCADLKQFQGEGPKETMSRKRKCN